jgi:malonate transporter MadM subunit
VIDVLEGTIAAQGLLVAFVVVGAIMFAAYFLSKHLTLGRIHGSAIAIVIGLILAWIGGTITGGSKGIVDIPFFAGIGIMGGAMLSSPLLSMST